MHRRIANLMLLLPVVFSPSCGSRQAGDCAAPTPQDVKSAHAWLAAKDPQCVVGQDALFPWRTVSAREASGTELRKTADVIAADALGLNVRDYRLMQLPKVEYAQGCDEGTCIVWVCTNRRWLRANFQTGTATASGTTDYTRLEGSALQQCRVALARQLLPASMVVESTTAEDGTLVQAIREVLKVEHEAIAVRYSKVEWEGRSVVRVGCWLDRSGW